MQELLKAFILIFVAEMGDKTQILAMAFATKYPVKKVLMGIFLGAFLNHGLAVLLGSTLSNLIPVSTIQIIAGLAFIGFSLWTLRSEDDEDGRKERRLNSGPVFTVALAFFIGELGDKTQLTAITLATDAVSPVAILAGTVSGMIVTGGIGIYIGKKLGDRIPEFAIKVIAAAIFMFFGVTKLVQTLPSHLINPLSVSLFTISLSVIVYFLLKAMLIKQRLGKESLLRKKSRELFQYYHEIEERINKICLGPAACVKCQGDHCIVGSTKTLIKNGLESHETPVNHSFAISEETYEKNFDREQTMEGLKATLAILRKDPNSDEYRTIQEIRKKFEAMLFKKSIDSMESWESYQQQIQEIDPEKAHTLMKAINE